MASSTQTHGKLLDYGQYIDHQLGRTRARIKMTDVLTGGLILLVAALTVLFLEVVLDHAIGLPAWLRRVILYSGLAWAGAFAVLRIVQPLIRHVSGYYAAKTIEDADPSFQNSLITYLDLRRRRDEVSKAVLAAIEKSAVNELTQVEIDTVVNQRRLMHVWYALSVVVLLFCLYAAMTPKSIVDSTRRAFLADVVRPTNTRLVNIKPGNDPELSRVVAGSHVPFSVDWKGTRPQRVVLHYSVDGGKFFAVQEFAPGANYYDSWQTTLRNVQQSMDYYITGGDAESLRYHLEVLPAPMITAVSLEYRFPAYLHLPPRTGIEGGNVEAIEGTIVTVHAETNQPARSASLVFTNAHPAPMSVSSDNPYQLTGQFKVEKSGTYSIKYRTTGGQANPDPVVYDIIALKDHPPTAQFLRPEQPKLRVPSNVPVVLSVHATDDHGVKDATLHVQQGREPLVSEDLVALSHQPPTREFRATRMLDLAALKVKPGARLEYWLTVRDTKEPQANRAETDRRVIEVIEPLSEEERQKAEESARRVKEQEEPQQTPEQAESAANREPPSPAETEARPRKDGGEADRSPRPGQAGENPRTKEQESPATADQAGPRNEPQDQKPTPEDLRELERLKKVFGMDQRRQAPQDGGASNAQNPPPSNPAQPNDTQTADNPNRGTNPSPSVASGNQGQRPQANAPTNPSPPTTAPNGSPNPNGNAPQVARANPQNQPNGNPQNQPGNTAQGQQQQGTNQNQPGNTARGQQQQTNPPGNMMQRQQGTNQPGNAAQGQQQGANQNQPGNTAQGQQGTNQPGNTAQGQQGTNQPGNTAQGQQGTNQNQFGNTAQGQQQQGTDQNQPGNAAQGQHGTDQNQPGNAAQGQHGTNQPGNTAQGQQGNHQNQPGNTAQNPQGTKPPGNAAQGQQGNNQPGNSAQGQQGRNPALSARGNHQNQPGNTAQGQQGNNPPGTTAQDQQGRNSTQDAQGNHENQPGNTAQGQQGNNPPGNTAQGQQNGNTAQGAARQNPSTSPGEQRKSFMDRMRDLSKKSRQFAQRGTSNQPPQSSTEENAQGQPSPRDIQNDRKSETKSAQNGARPGARAEDTSAQPSEVPADSNQTEPRPSQDRGSDATQSNAKTQANEGADTEGERARQPTTEEPVNPPESRPESQQPPSPPGQPGLSSGQPGQQTGAPGQQPGQSGQAGTSPGQTGLSNDQGAQNGQPSNRGTRPGQSEAQSNQSGQGRQGGVPGQGPAHVPPGDQHQPSDQAQGQQNQPGEGAPSSGAMSQGQPQPNPSGRGRNQGQQGTTPPQANPSGRLARRQGEQTGQPSPAPDARNPGQQGQPESATESPLGPGSPRGRDGQRSPGGVGSVPRGGGGPRPGSPGGPAAPDVSKPSPRAESKPMNAEETVAPDVPQSELVLRKLEDLLRSNQVTPQLEKETGMSREQMEQFVQKFKRAPKAPPGPGRRIEVKPGQAKTFDQNRSLPDLNLNRSIGTKSVRTRNQFAQDQERNMNEGERYEAPAEIQSRFEAYKSTLSRSRTVNPTRITPAQGAGGQ